MLKPHSVTIKDIAKELKISVATVSRALRNAYDVSPVTREQVVSKATEMSYVPNYNAIGLVKKSSFNIGVVLPAVINYYFSTVISGIQQVAYENGYNIVLFVTNDSADREKDIVNAVSPGNIDGLLICVSSGSDQTEHFTRVMNKGVPIVFFDRVAPDIHTSKVMQDDFNGAYKAVTHLIKQGYKKIAHITGPADLLLTEKRMSGYLAALKDHYYPVKQEWIIHSGFTRECGADDMRRLLACRHKPDAIFAVNDRKAIGAMMTLKKAKIKSGKEIGVAGFTNDPVSEIISPSLTTIEEPGLEIGKKSCELLLKHIYKPHFIAEEITLPTKLIIRESTQKV
ncbi:MAG: LacI family DNA-binding transcriptional regulator [Agriterribacter sp.]